MSLQLKTNQKNTPTNKLLVFPFGLQPLFSKLINMHIQAYTLTHTLVIILSSQSVLEFVSVLAPFASKLSEFIAYNPLKHTSLPGAPQTSSAVPPTCLYQLKSLLKPLKLYSVSAFLDVLPPLSICIMQTFAIPACLFNRLKLVLCLSTVSS